MCTLCRVYCGPCIVKLCGEAELARVSLVLCGGVCFLPCTLSSFLSLPLTLSSSSYTLLFLFLLLSSFSPSLFPLPLPSLTLIPLPSLLPHSLSPPLSS